MNPPDARVFSCAHVRARPSRAGCSRNPRLDACTFVRLSGKLLMEAELRVMEAELRVGVRDRRFTFPGIGYTRIAL